MNIKFGTKAAFGLLMSTLLFNQAHASGWILSAATTAGASFQVGATSADTYSLNLGAGTQVMDDLEAILFTDYLRTSSGDTTTWAVDIEGQLGYLLSGSGSTAFYVGPRLGRLIAFSGSRTAAYIFGAVIGKRFALDSWVAFDPSVAISDLDFDNGGGSKLYLHFVPIQFTFFF